MIINKLLLLFIAGIATISAVSQVKYERELRVKSHEVPKMALTFVDSLQLRNKVKWYKELSINKTSFEAKSKWQGKKISIEFSENGQFEDLEIGVTKNQMPATTLRKITVQLDTLYDSHRIKKIQRQYTGDTEKIKALLLRKDSAAEQLTVRYEMVVAVKLQGSFEMYELLFTAEGALVKRARVKQNITDNLEY